MHFAFGGWALLKAALAAVAITLSGDPRQRAVPAALVATALLRKPADAAGHLQLAADGKCTIGESREAAAVRAFERRLPDALARAEFGRQNTLWGVSLARPSRERSSLLSTFLRARSWNVDVAEAMLVKTLQWRREQRINGLGGEPIPTDEAGYPEDTVRTLSKCGADGRPLTYVVVCLGGVPRSGFKDPQAFVRWRLRMQERACEHIGGSRGGRAGPGASKLGRSRLVLPFGRPRLGGEAGRKKGLCQFSSQPRGPTYTLVLDCAGLRPFHFTKSAKAVSEMARALQTYYPDFVGETLIVNTPAFAPAMWSIVKRAMPAWWKVRFGSLAELHESECMIGAAGVMQ